MTKYYFLLVLGIVVGNAVFWAWLLSRPFVAKLMRIPDRIEAGSASTVSVMFSLFLAFSTSDIYQSARDLNLAVQKEVNVARSMFKYAESIGESANPVRQALIEYMQVISTLEQGWLEGSGTAVSPSQETVDTLVQVATLFVVQSPAPSAVKSLIVAKVDELRQARTERIILSVKSSGLPQWIVLTIVAMITQIVILLGYVEKRWSQRFVVGCFSLAAISAMCYLAWIDGVIGPAKFEASLRPLSDLLQSVILTSED